VKILRILCVILPLGGLVEIVVGILFVVWQLFLRQPVKEEYFLALKEDKWWEKVIKRFRKGKDNV